MTGDELAQAAKTFFVWVARIVLYPVHTTYRVSVRLLALLAVFSSVLLGLMLPVGVLLRVAEAMLDPQQYTGPFWGGLRGLYESLHDEKALGIIALLVSLSIVSTLVTHFGKAAGRSLVDLGQKVAAASKGDWFPGWRVRASIAATKDQLNRIPEHWRESFLSAGKTMLVLLAIVILVWLAWFSQGKSTDSTVRHVVAPVEAFVAVVAAERVEREEVKDHMQAGMTFALIHPKNAQGSGEGICLEESHQGFLNTLNEAIRECILSGGKESWAQNPTFDVEGFASISPASPGNMPDAGASEKVNCEFANRRAHAVAAYLVDGEAAPAGKWRCDSVGKNLASAKSLCDASEEQDYATTTGVPFNVRVRHWQKAEDMQDNKPANDGSLPTKRRYRVEALNRAVHIHVPEGFCAVEKEEKRAVTTAA